MATPLRIRDDLVPWVEAEAASLGISIPALVNSLIERASVHGRLAEARPQIVPPGISPESKVLEQRDLRVVLTFNEPSTPWPQVIAGYIKDFDGHALDLEVFDSGPIVRIPRIWLVTWHIAGPTDDFTLVITRAVTLYQGIGMRLHPLVRVRAAAQQRPVAEVLPIGTKAIVRFRKPDGSQWVIAGQITRVSGTTRFIQPEGEREVPLDITALIGEPETYADWQKAGFTVSMWAAEGFNVHPAGARAWGPAVTTPDEYLRQARRLAKGGHDLRLHSSSYHKPGPWYVTKGTSMNDAVVGSGATAAEAVNAALSFMRAMPIRAGEDEDVDDRIWVEKARERLKLAFEHLKFDKRARTVSVGVDDAQGGVTAEEFDSFDSVRQALIELAEVELSAHAPFEGGEPVFDLSADDMVDSMLEEYGVTEFFHAR
jgi:hypothetical protein